MITLDKLDKLRLDEVQIENFAAEEMILDSLEGASEQGRQGWGVRREQAVLLGMATHMRVLARLAEQSETAHNNLKGEQMAHGRLKKRYAEVLTDRDRTRKALESVEAGRKELAEVLNAATIEKLELTARLDQLENKLLDNG